MRRITLPALALAATPAATLAAPWGGPTQAANIDTTTTAAQTPRFFSVDGSSNEFSMGQTFTPNATQTSLTGLTLFIAGRSSHIPGITRTDVTVRGFLEQRPIRWNRSGSIGSG